jgi:hypothetical protein
MKEFTFPAWCQYGKGDVGESEITVDLNDEDAELLEKYASDPDVYYDGFDACLELSFLYDLIFKLADEQITEEIKSGEIWEFEEGETASDVYPIGIEFPLEFEPK